MDQERNDRSPREVPELSRYRRAKFSRRSFIGATMRKATYVVPAMTVLTAQQAMAGNHLSPGASCLSLGETCVVNADCCNNNCVDMGTKTCTE